MINLWAKVIIAKNTQVGESILGDLGPYSDPIPYSLKVKDIEEDEAVLGIESMKVTFNPREVREDFLTTNKVITNIPFTAYFWLKTSKRYIEVNIDWVYIKENSVGDFLKSDGSPLTEQEYRDNVTTSVIEIKNYSLGYTSILPKDPYVPGEQTIEIIITADITDMLGNYQEIAV